MVMIFQVKLVHIAGLLVCIPLSVHRILDVHSIHSLMFERIPIFPPYDEDDDDYNDDKEKESSDDYADNGRDRAG